MIRKRINISAFIVATTLLSTTTKCSAGREEDRSTGKLFGKNRGFSSEKLEEFFPPSLLDATNKVLESGAPGQLGYGFMMGYSSGYCVKKVSKGVAFVVGGLFMAIQALAYHGYANIDNSKIQKDVEKVMDMNRDGKVDIEDAKMAIDKLTAALTFNMPAGGGFSAGLLMGLRN